MDQLILRNPEIVLRLAILLFGEIRDADELQFFLPFSVADVGGLWQVMGRRQAAQKSRSDEFEDQFENEIFYMQVAKADAEVSDLCVEAVMKLPPQMEAQSRTALENTPEVPADPGARRPTESSSYLWLYQLMRGGIINSSESAIKFAKILFERQFSPDAENLRNIRCKESGDLWHVHAEAEGRSAELVFRRSNAQVLSLDLRPGPL